MNSHYLLLLAILFEVCGTTCMKLSQGFSKILPSILIFVFYAVSFFLFTLALKGMDVSIAYAVWAGLGTALITIIGILWFREPVNSVKMISLFIVVVGLIGLNLSDRITWKNLSNPETIVSNMKSTSKQIVLSWKYLYPEIRTR